MGIFVHNAYFTFLVLLVQAELESIVLILEIRKSIVLERTLITGVIECKHGSPVFTKWSCNACVGLEVAFGRTLDVCICTKLLGWLTVPRSNDVTNLTCSKSTFGKRHNTHVTERTVVTPTCSRNLCPECVNYWDVILVDENITCERKTDVQCTRCGRITCTQHNVTVLYFLALTTYLCGIGRQCSIVLLRIGTKTASK